MASEISHPLTAPHPQPATTWAPWQGRYIPCLTPHNSLSSLYLLPEGSLWRSPSSASSPLRQGFLQGGSGLVPSLASPWPQEDSHDSGLTSPWGCKMLPWLPSLVLLRQDQSLSRGGYSGCSGTAPERLRRLSLALHCPRPACPPAAPETLGPPPKMPAWLPAPLTSPGFLLCSPSPWGEALPCLPLPSGEEEKHHNIPHICEFAF